MRVLSVGTTRIRWSGLLLLAAITAGPARAENQERAQNQELTFSLGGIPGQTRSLQGSAGRARISADRSFGINYGHRFLGAKIAALYGEIEFVAIPNRALTAATATVPQNYASLYLTPGLRLKLFPRSRLSAWGAIGGGYALYQQWRHYSALLKINRPCGTAVGCSFTVSVKSGREFHCGLKLFRLTNLSLRCGPLTLTRVILASIRSNVANI